MAARPKYGIDAPGVIRNLLLAGAASVVLGLVLPPVLHLGASTVQLRPTAFSIGVSVAFGGALMLLYALVGKFHHRDRMLDLHPWRGDEQVLDIGTGRGLLLVSAARRIPTGHATGIDIWNREDLSGNALDRTERNLALEGVADRCTLLNEAVQTMSFPDNSFDVVLSNLCLHNIDDQATRRHACTEIARVLKPGGVAILSDYKLTGEYAHALRSSGLKVERKFPNLLTTFPPLRILIARKS